MKNLQNWQENKVCFKTQKKLGFRFSLLKAFAFTYAFAPPSPHFTSFCS
jgi:hypothetical protein